MSLSKINAAKFEKFWSTIGEDLDLPETTKAVFQEGLQKAGFFDAPSSTSVSISASASKGKGSKPATGYNLFTSHKMKVEGVPFADAMKLWKPLSDEEKAPWIALAKGEDPEATSTQVKGKKPSSGFNLYVQHRTKVDKVPLPEASKEWKPLSDEEKAPWIAKAKALKSQ